MKKVLITSRTFGQVSREPFELLEAHSIQADFTEKVELLSEEEFSKLIMSYDALIIGADLFTDKVMSFANKLKIVCKHGTGLDNLDVDAATRHKIIVTNVPSVNADAVADATFGLMLDVSRKISWSVGRIKNGFWDKSIGVDVCNKVLGIIGLGAIGKKVAQRANGFGMTILGYDPFITQLSDEMPFVKMTSLHDVFTLSDIVTLHVPLNAQTNNMLAAPQMAAMKEGSFIINTSRGGIVNEDDLYEYLWNHHLGGAAIDVPMKEPPFESPLLKLDNVTITPHLASYSKESLNTISMVCAKNVVNALTGAESKIKYCVNHL